MCKGFRERATFELTEFLSAPGISMAYAEVAYAGDVCAHTAFDPLARVRVRSQVDIFAHLKRYREDLLLQRKTSKNYREREFGLAGVESSAVDDPVSRTVVRISNIVEVQEVEF